MSGQCAILGVGAFSARFANASAFTSRTELSAPAAASGELLDKHSRRRASDLTKACADVYREALTQAGCDALEVAAVFGSAVGEASVTIGLLEQMWRGPGMLSPMRFAASVHNASAGVVSIGTKNTGFTTALGADFDTPAMALLEGMAFALVHETPVIVVCADEGAPENLVSADEGWEALACAVALAPAGRAPAGAPYISAPFIDADRKAGWLSPELPSTLARNPSVGLLDLIAAVAQRDVGVVRLDRGRGHGYCVKLRR
jgi:hypothetical protein